MSDNSILIHAFYTAFAQADANQMLQCYHNDIVFEDPVFGVLHGENAKAMWRMLVRPGIKISYHNVVADGQEGSADLTAEYEFGAKKRHVINHIHAEFRFRDGRIIKHTDSFSFWNWSRQALGLIGLLLGWTGWLKMKVRKQVSGRLRAFERRT